MAGTNGGWKNRGPRECRRSNDERKTGAAHLNSFDIRHSPLDIFAVPDEPVIDLQSDQFFMGEALRQAARACEAGEVPVGAIVVREGHIIARAFNQVELLKDATAHAEMLALTQAQEVVGDWRLTDCTLYVTKEPCPMCAGAMVHVRLARVVYGVSDVKAGAAGSVLNLLQFPTLNHRCEITGGLREAECRALLQNFFAEQRVRQKLEVGQQKPDGQSSGLPPGGRDAELS